MTAVQHAATYLNEAKEIIELIDPNTIETMAIQLKDLRDRNGRLFIFGVGGSAANAAHAVNDFRKLCGIETYAPTDNVSELTARTNDEGWETVFSGWLKVSRANQNDAVLVLSVGGGNAEKNVSMNIVKGLQEAKERKLTIFGIVGRDGGYTKQIGDNVLVVPSLNADRVTPHVEAFQAVLWHCLVSHPILQINSTKW
jgi:D-sedoheptulose 7-phosphate isomerase